MHHPQRRQAASACARCWARRTKSPLVRTTRCPHSVPIPRQHHSQATLTELHPIFTASLWVHLNGGYYVDTPQKALFQFICDPNAPDVSFFPYSVPQKCPSARYFCPYPRMLPDPVSYLSRPIDTEFLAFRAHVWLDLQWDTHVQLEDEARVREVAGRALAAEAASTLRGFS